MYESESRFARAAIREGAVFTVAVLAAVLFDVHRSFYAGQFRTLDMPAWVFALLVVILYLLIRMLFLIGALFYPHRKPELVLCPECGRMYDESHPAALEDHRRIPLTPRPTEREIVAAVMLRKAIDDARRSSTHSLSGPRVDAAAPPPGEIENPPVSLDEFQRILKDLDFANAPRRGPRDRRAKGPPELPR